MKIKAISEVEERDQEEGGGKAKGKYWGLTLAKFGLQCLPGEHATTTSTIRSNYNAPIKNRGEGERTRESRSG